MKFNPKHHLPLELVESIDDHYESLYEYYDGYYDDDYCSSYALYDYHAHDKTYTYAYVKELDKFIFNPNLKNFGDYRTELDLYEDSDGTLYHGVYSFTHHHKLTAMNGCVIEAMKDISNPSKRLSNLYEKLSNEYPEITLRLL